MTKKSLSPSPRLLEYLYGELPESELEAYESKIAGTDEADELESFANVLDMYRTHSIPFEGSQNLAEVALRALEPTETQGVQRRGSEPDGVVQLRWYRRIILASSSLAAVFIFSIVVKPAKLLFPDTSSEELSAPGVYANDDRSLGGDQRSLGRRPDGVDYAVEEDVTEKKEAEKALPSTKPLSVTLAPSPSPIVVGAAARGPTKGKSARQRLAGRGGSPSSVPPSEVSAMKKPKLRSERRRRPSIAPPSPPAAEDAPQEGVPARRRRPSIAPPSPPAAEDAPQEGVPARPLPSVKSKPRAHVRRSSHPVPSSGVRATETKSWITQAEAAIKAREWGRGRRILETAESRVSSVQDRGTVWLLRGELELQAGRFDEAVRFATQAQKLEGFKQIGDAERLVKKAQKALTSSLK